MFRKLLFSSVAALGLLSPLAVTSNADAHPVRHEYRHHAAYRVYYRDPCRPSWVYAGSFSHRHEAVRFAAGYRSRGMLISVR
jgi:hypothetical protein